MDYKHTKTGGGRYNKNIVEIVFLTRILKESRFVKSTSDALRMIKQGAVKVNDEKVSDSKFSLSRGTSSLVQVGKKKVAKINID